DTAGPTPGSPLPTLPPGGGGPNVPDQTSALDGVQASLEALAGHVAGLEATVAQEQYADSLQRYEEDAQGRALGELRRDAAPSLTPAPASTTPAPNTSAE